MFGIAAWVQLWVEWKIAGFSRLLFLNFIALTIGVSLSGQSECYFMVPSSAREGSYSRLNFSSVIAPGEGRKAA